MSVSPVPASRPSRFTVTCGLDLLDEWSAHATQAQKNIVHRVIFSVADKSVFTDYVVVDDVENHMEFFVLAKSDLAVKIRIDGLDSFGILYIGPSSDVEGLDPVWAASISEPSSLSVGDAAQQDAATYVNE